jgi:anthranilate synthase component 2
VRNDKVPEAIKVTAVDSEGVIMALRHQTLDVRGVQFHPESVLTEHGKLLITNWLS